MNELSVIPQIFFDLIARVIPGSLLIVSVLFFRNGSWCDDLMRQIFISGSNCDNFTFVSAAVFLGASYLLGQLLSPLVKLFQRIGEWISPVVKTNLLVNGKKCGGYNYLRLNHPEAGGLSAKIRAEFVMHYGLSLVLFIICVLVHFSKKDLDVDKCCIIFICIVLSVIEFIRAGNTNKTFNDTVNSFCLAIDKLNISNINNEVKDPFFKRLWNNIKNLMGRNKLKTYDIYKYDEDWVVKASDEEEIIIIEKSRNEAINEMEELAKKRGNTQVVVVIHNIDGTIQKEISYPKLGDPSSSKR